LEAGGADALDFILLGFEVCLDLDDVEAGSTWRWLAILRVGISLAVEG
jgi:hypothetical protein